MNKIQIMILGITLLFVFGERNRNAFGEYFSENLRQYQFCHRCGMAIEKNDRIITVTWVEEEPWYECCPMCALIDIIETGKGNSAIIAFCNKTGQQIKISIENNQIVKMEPQSAILLVGGSCPKNKIFYTEDYAMQFITETEWAKKEMLKPAPKAFAMLKDKAKAHTRCSMCTTTLKGHEKTGFTITTTAKKRMVLCCGHCGLFMMYKLKDKAKRTTTPDFVTGKLIDARHAYYVVGNNLLLCCFPSTISFEDKKDAEEFQKIHKGEILTFQEAMLTINKVMKGACSKPVYPVKNS